MHGSDCCDTNFTLVLRKYAKIEHAFLSWDKNTHFNTTSNIKFVSHRNYTIINPVFQEFGNKKRRIHKKHSESERKQKNSCRKAGVFMVDGKELESLTFRTSSGSSTS